MQSILALLIIFIQLLFSAVVVIDFSAPAGSGAIPFAFIVAALNIPVLYLGWRDIVPLAKSATDAKSSMGAIYASLGSCLGAFLTMAAGPHVGAVLLILALIIQALLYAWIFRRKKPQ